MRLLLLQAILERELGRHGKHKDGMDDPALASLALQGALLCALAHGLFKPLLFLGAGAVKNATGTNSLDWLGGLIRGMPRLGLLMMAGCAGMAALDGRSRGKRGTGRVAACVDDACGWEGSFCGRFSAGDWARVWMGENSEHVV